MDKGSSDGRGEEIISHHDKNVEKDKNIEEVNQHVKNRKRKKFGGETKKWEVEEERRRG